ncbi:glycosyl hydrolase [Fulvivirgaceae bacterium BMA10]|uniref:Glycosyl hydrolase n=1 Tax=Splendidivirga corallicola TaxID=3051826 RepID=A0ABT8KIF4_9BACT|nr:glycosyl hydrolase [Fulvivirgaceae bacterium BMA10]
MIRALQFSALLTFCYGLLQFTLAQHIDMHALDSLKFRFIGPEGNRAIAIAGVPGDPMINYIGAASGGLWKTTDGGLNWQPVFDKQSASSIGSIAIAPNNPDQIWVGTGETFVIRPAHAMGDGIYKSNNAGKTWKNMGLEKTGRIGRVVVHPQNPNVVFVAALGHTYGPQKERGIYKTSDGGNTWKQVLFVDEGTGAADIAIDPENPDILYAAMWSVHINSWGLRSGGAGGGIYKSTDGGETWEPLYKNGLPGGKDHPVGKTAVAISHSNPDIIYALFEIESPALYRSNDKGASWELMTRNHTINERAPYYTRIVVAPDNPDEIYFLSVRFSKSIDGGKTLLKNPPRGGGDNHDMWIDPTNPDRMMVAHDGCASMSLNRGKSFNRIVLPIAQMYHVSVDDQIPYYVYGNRQDGYSYRGPSNSLQGYIPIGLWHGVGGCESGFAKPDPADNNIVWSGCYDGGLERYDLRTGHARDVRVWPEAGYGWAPADMKYRWHWNFPLSFSPHVKHRVYVGSQFVHQSDDGGQSWQIISPDLTLNDKSHQQSSGGIAIDNLMTFDGATLFAIEESSIEPGVIWVGSNDGQVNITRDAGKTWINVTQNIKDLPPWGTIANIEPSRFEKGTAYITVDMHQMGSFDPYVFKTTDYGKTWISLSRNIPKSVHSFAHVIKEDPEVPGLLFLGVDNGIYVSPDDGKNWSALKNNLPPAPVYWLEIQQHFGDLVVGTYGRGYYILDDITPIRQLAKEANGTDIHLFDLRAAYRFNDKQSIKTDGPSLNSGRNPSYGAIINYYFKEEQKEEAIINILNAEGEIIRSLRGTRDKGVNRIAWDLRYEPTYKPRLRTTPPGRPWVQLNGEGWRPLVTWDLDLWRGQFGPRVVPGTYQVQLKVGDHTITKALEVRKDPNSEGSVESIREQVALSLKLRDAMNIAVNMINKVEILREELETLIPSLRRKTEIEEAQRLLNTATTVASKLYDIHLTGAREDAFRSPMKLYGRLSALASDINGSGIDFQPTDQQGEVYQVLNGRLLKVRNDFSELIEKDIKNFNQQLAKKNLKIDLEKKG